MKLEQKENDKMRVDRGENGMIHVIVSTVLMTSPTSKVRLFEIALTLMS